MFGFGGCCIIPVRRGSKRIPGKNLKLLGNQPLLSHILQTALQSNCFNVHGTVVASDDPNALRVAKDMGAIPFEIPSAMAGDDSPVTPVLALALNALPTTPDFMCYLRATSPFVTASTIQQAVQSFASSPRHIDSLVTVHQVTGAHPSRYKSIDEQTGLLIDKYSNFKEGLQPTSSSSLTALQRNSCVTVTRRETLLGTDHSIWGNQTIPLVVQDEMECLDINTPLDFEFAEYLYHSKETATTNKTLSKTKYV